MLQRLYGQHKLDFYFVFLPFGEVTGVEEAELGRLESQYDVRFPNNQ